MIQIDQNSNFSSPASAKGKKNTSEKTYRKRSFLVGGFLKWWYPTTIGFPTKNYDFGVFWGYHHLRKHPVGAVVKLEILSPILGIQKNQIPWETTANVTKKISPFTQVSVCHSPSHILWLWIPHKAIEDRVTPGCGIHLVDGSRQKTTHRFSSNWWFQQNFKKYYKVGPLPVITGFITPITIGL